MGEFIFTNKTIYTKKGGESLNELTFKDSRSTCHKIVTDSNGKRYIMDTSTIRPKVYGFGFLPKQVSVDMVELGYHDQNFEFMAKPSPLYTGAVVSTQSLSRSLLRSLEGLFLMYNIHQKILLKLGVLALPVFISYVLAKIYIKQAQKKVAERLPKNAKRYTATFTFAKKRDFSYWIGIGVVGIFVFLYMKTNNASEGGFLIPISLLSLLFFIVGLGMAPVDYKYKNQFMKLVSIEEKQ